MDIPLNSYFLYPLVVYFTKIRQEVDRYYALYGEGKEDLTGVGREVQAGCVRSDTNVWLNGDYKISGAGNENSDLQYLSDSIHILFFSVSHWEEHGKGFDVNAMFPEIVGKQYVIRNDWMKLILFQTHYRQSGADIFGKNMDETIRTRNSLV